MENQYTIVELKMLHKPSYNQIVVSLLLTRIDEFSGMCL